MADVYEIIFCVIPPFNTRVFKNELYISVLKWTLKWFVTDVPPLGTMCCWHGENLAYYGDSFGFILLIPFTV